MDSNVLWLTCCSHTTLHYCILFFIYWIDLLNVRVYIFYFTMYYKLLHYFFKEKIGAIFFYSVIYLWFTDTCTFIFYMLMFFFVFFGDVHRCTFIFYMLIKYTLLYLFGLLTWLISMVRSIYKPIETNLAHSRLNIAWGVWTKLCTKYMERSRSSNIFKVTSQRSRKKMEFDIFVTAVSLCPTCNTIPPETFKY